MSKAIIKPGVFAPAMSLGFLFSTYSIERPATAATVIEDGREAIAERAPDAPPGREDLNGNGLSDKFEAGIGGLGASERVDVVVILSGPGDAASAQRAVGAFAVAREFTIIDGFSATMTVGQARALAGRPGVRRVEEAFEVSIEMETERADFGADAVHAGAHGGASRDGQGVGICVIDSGIRTTHIAFNNGDIAFNNGYRVVASINTIDGGSVEDDHSHGTHVTGIAAGGCDNNGANLDEMLYGVAPEADIYVVKALAANGTGTSPDVIAGVQWCAGQAGVDVINMSLTDSVSSDGLDALSTAVNNAVLNSGKVVVVAAGNAGPTPYSIGSPSAAAEAITVGAVAEWSVGTTLAGNGEPINLASDGGVFLAPFSSRGPTADNRVKPDIVAPGVGVLSAYWGGDYSYAFGSGSSMAAPYVAGAVALMLEANPNLTPAQVKQMLYDTAQDRGPTDALGNPQKDDEYGHGLIDVQASVGLADTAIATPTQTAFPTYQYFDTLAAPITDVPIPAGNDATGYDVPLNVMVAIDGEAECIGGFIFNVCLLGYEWRPDLDVRLYDPVGFEVDLSTCAVDTNCGNAPFPVGRQETLIETSSVTGNYLLQVFSGAADSPTGTFVYEISTGPLAVGQTRTTLGNSAPIADAGVDRTVDYGELVALDGSGSYDSDGPIVSYAWSWSGGSASGATPTVALPDGQTDVTLTVTDNDGATDSAMVTITVTAPAPAANQRPVAQAKVQDPVSLNWLDALAIKAPKGKNAEVLLQFSGSQSYDVDGSLNPGNFAWTDGTFISAGIDISQPFGKGVHYVTLTVTDNGNPALSDTDTVCIEVYGGKNPEGLCTTTSVPTPPVASFTYSCTDLACSFADPSSSTDGDAITGWTWDFGSEGTSTAQNPSYTFSSTGTYPVNLTVTDKDVNDFVIQDVSVSVGGGGTMAVGSITFSVKGKGLTGTVKVNPPVSGVMVNASFCRYEGCPHFEVDQVTNGKGEAPYKIINFSKTATYKLTVHSLNGIACTVASCTKDN